MNSKSLAYLPIAVALLFTINACKKSDNPGKFPDLKGVYVAANTQELSAPLMYTSKGKITNQDTISTYLNPKQFVKQFFTLDATFTSKNKNGAMINFQDNGVVIITDSLSNYSAKFIVTQKNATGFVLEAIDTSAYFENNQTIGQLEPRSQMLAENISTINKISNCFPVPAQTGYSRQCTFRDVYQFIIKDEKIYLFSFAYVISNNNNGYISYNGFSNQSGYFNTSVLKQLIAGDTIVYQAQTVLFSKK